MEVEFQDLEHDPNHIGWIKCEPSDIEEIQKTFPVEEYELLVAIRPTYDPLTCDYHTLMNPPPGIWGLDIRKRDDAGHQDLSPRENP